MNEPAPEHRLASVSLSVCVRYAETDQMGVAHHANYLVWFEAARSAFCRERGVPYSRIERDLGLMLPVVEASVRYKLPAHYEDELTIDAHVAERTRRTIRFAYLVRRGKTELAHGHTTHMLVDANGRPRTWPDDVAAALDRAAWEPPSLDLEYATRPPRRRGSGLPPMLLLIHGWNSTPEEILTFAPCMDGRFFVVAPRGPIETEPGRYAWMNVDFTPDGPRDHANEAARSVEMLAAFARKVAAQENLDASHIYLMGFSQGAVMATSLALHAPDRCAGLVSMSGQTPVTHAMAPGALMGLAAFVAHGLDDSLVLPARAGELRDALHMAGARVTFREYPMGHEATTRSLGEIASWLSARLDGE